MEAYLQEWLGLLLRWAHFITGVAWIGASFYFNWLENHLEREQSRTELAGDLWAIHGGGFKPLQLVSHRCCCPGFFMICCAAQRWAKTRR